MPDWSNTVPEIEPVSAADAGTMVRRRRASVPRAARVQAKADAVMKDECVGSYPIEQAIGTGTRVPAHLTYFFPSQVRPIPPPCLAAIGDTKNRCDPML